MRSTLATLIFVFCYGTWSWGVSYELPIIVKNSPYYYVPQSKLENAEKNIFFSSKSYSEAQLERWSLHSGCRRCEYQNNILVDKKTKEKRKLFESDRNISTFFVTGESKG